MPTTLVNTPWLPDRPTDRWLRFDPEISQRYEEEHRHERVAELRVAIAVGLILYNAFNFSDLILLPDVVWLTIVARVAAATPLSIALLSVLHWLPPLWRERIVALAVINAALLPVPGFITSQAPQALFAFSEFFLSVVYANMLLALRFRHACAVTLACFAIGIGSLLARDGSDGWLVMALAFQFATVCVFSLYANYLTERRRCRDYLAELSARMHSDAEERARTRFQALADIDALTGLANRRVLNARLDEWSKDDAGVVVAMIDIDHFKLYNDRLGHPAGDECIQQVAAVLHAVSDDHIVAARYGGEEFTLAMRGIAELDALRIVREVLRNIESLGILNPGRTDGTTIVTASAGVAICPSEENWTAASIVLSADRALYVAKGAGRAQLSIAS